MILLTIAQAAACAYVMYVCVLVLNRISKTTRHMIRLSFIVLTVGGAMGVITSLQPSTSTCLMGAGTALFLALNERRKGRV